MDNSFNSKLGQYRQYSHKQATGLTRQSRKRHSKIPLNGLFRGSRSFDGPVVAGLWVTQDLQEVVRPYLKLTSQTPNHILVSDLPPKPPNHILGSELFSHPLLQLGTGIIRHETATFGGRRGFLAVKLKRMGPVLRLCRIWDLGMSRDTMPELSPGEVYLL